MRKELINYPSSLPLEITYASVKEYPIHWHNSIEIIYVLQGSIKISIDTDTFELYENELEIINVDESHSISSDNDNRLLIFHIDPKFLSKYYKDIKNIYFYTNTSDEGAQDGIEYDTFRKLLSELLFEYVKKLENHDEEIEKILIDLLYHLINNFHYLIYEQSELKDNKEQLDRYHRISKYIYNNYSNNITLQEIAKKEFLSPHYLSHEIKNATGSSFTSLLNLTRVEESVKLLINSDLSISEICNEVGFSHTRYLNKHFKYYYGCTPLQFRRKNKVTEKEYEHIKKFNNLDLSQAIEKISYLLEDYKRFNYENKLWNIHVDMGNVSHKFDMHFRDILSIGDAFDLLIEDNKDILEELQEEINFDYGRLENFFSKDMGVFRNNNFFNWNRARSVLEFLEYIELKPLIVLDNTSFSFEDYKNALESFYSYFKDIEYYYLSTIKFQLSTELTKEIKEMLIDFINNNLELEILTEEYIPNNTLDPIYDTAYMLPLIIHNEVTNKNKMMNTLKAFDVLEKETHLTNEVFIGAPGLINDISIRKPSYYAYYLLSKLSKDIVAQDDGYIITKNDDNYSILLYTYNENFEDFDSLNNLFTKKGLKKTLEKKVSLNLTNISTDSKIILYKINEKIGSSYDYWTAMGKPDRLNKEELEILSKASFPKIEFRYAKKSPVLNIITDLSGYGATLILIRPMKNK